MNVEKLIPASKETIWNGLNSPEILKASIPGCDLLEEAGDNGFVAQITAKVGPVKAKFKFDVVLKDLDPPNSYTIDGKGQGGAAGFANGSAHVVLSEHPDGTLLAYQVKANVGGKLAQLGGRLIDGTAAKLADEFFENFIANVATDESETGEQESEQASGNPEREGAGADSSSPIVLWLVGGALLVAGAWWLLSN